MSYCYSTLKAALPTYERMREIAARVDAMKHRRAVIAYHQAFGAVHVPADASLDCCVIHNSLVDRERGRPWREINYSKMRLAARLVDDFRASRICSAFYRRKAGLPAE